MSYQQKDNSGTLFKNEKKSQPSQPDYDGTVLVGGVEYRIAAWIKGAESGRKFMSLAFTPKEANREPQKPMRMKDEVPRARQTRDDDLPPF
jgi:uncharacterized protein (DUF736 family)